MLRYTLGGRSGLIERQARPIEVEIPCPPFLEFTSIPRRPGISACQGLLARAVVAPSQQTTRSRSPSPDLTDLKSANDGQTLPVFYA